MSRTEADLWGGSGVRFFISHSHVDKLIAAELKEHLESLGAQAFVAHEDIEPTQPWQDEMRHALDSMNVLVALLTKDFKKSKWTDQEVGYAIASEVPVMPVRIDTSPYGFMSAVQALRGSDPVATWAFTLLKYALGIDDLTPTCFKTVVNAVKRCPNYETADLVLDDVIPLFRDWTPRRARKLVRAYNENSQVYDAVRYRNRAFLTALNQQTDGKFTLDKNYKLRWSPP